MPCIGKPVHASSGRRCVDLPASVSVTVASWSLYCSVQDLNKGVIEMATFANVIKNATVSGQGETDTHLQARFIDGDFISASDVLCSTLGCRRFDLILTAESIYNPTSVPQLLAAFNRCLSPAGVILVAAKSYYFGVGGGVASFKKAIDADGLFKCAVLARVDDGKSNIREVLLLRRI